MRENESQEVIAILKDSEHPTPPPPQVIAILKNNERPIPPLPWLWKEG